MCQFSGRSVVSYSMACGHYRVYDDGSIEFCHEAESKTKLGSKGYLSTERQICDAIINEIERQRPSRSWSFHCCINGNPIEVLVDSSGHCEVWKKGGYKKPTYQQFPGSPGIKVFETSSDSDNGVSRQIKSADTVISMNASTLSSSKAIPKVRLFARLQNGIAKKWNRLILPEHYLPQQASASVSGASEHDRARGSSEGTK